MLTFASLIALLIGTVLAGSAGATPTPAASGPTYIVLYAAQAVPADAAATIAAAGGSLVYKYNQIGVALAASANSTFAANLRRDSRIAGVAATAGFASQIGDVATSDNAAAPAPGTPAPGDDSLSALQWDMTQIHVPEARAITAGSSSVLVGDIDTGLDYHPSRPGAQRRLRQQRLVRGRRARSEPGCLEGRQRSRHAHGRHHRRGARTASASSA